MQASKRVFKVSGKRVSSRLFILVQFFLSLAVALSACSSSTNSHQISGNGPGGSNLPNFPDSQDFYKLPSSVPYEPPGTLVRVQQVGTAGGYTTLRVMYHSTDSHSHDALVTGLVTYPDAKAPSGGWPVISWDHGTIGMSQSCAPSRMGLSGASPNFSVQADYVETDYLGLGIDGEISPYLNRLTEGYSTIDIVRALKYIPDAHASNNWLVVGDSEGGHAALATGELAPSYAPEIHLLGTVAVAPGAMLSQTFPSDNPILIDLITVMVVYGYHASDPSVDPNQVIAPAAQGLGKLIDTECAGQVATNLIGIYQKTNGHIFKYPPLQSPLGETWLKNNDVPQAKTQSPILVIAGGQDVIAVPARINALVPKLCALGDTVSIQWFKDATHLNETEVATPEIGAWLKDRLAGKSPPSNCPYTPPAST